jgi:hypothetical protein
MRVLMTKFSMNMLYQIYSIKLDISLDFRITTLVPGRIYPT